MIGKTLAHHRITASIGEGGMVAVHRATDTKFRREAALKVLPAEMAASRERLERFRREAKAPLPSTTRTSSASAPSRASRANA